LKINKGNIMAQLNDTMVHGDLRVTGTVYGNATSASSAEPGSILELSIIKKSDSTHTHSIKINGNTETIAASGGTAVDLGTYLPLIQTDNTTGVDFHSDTYKTPGIYGPFFVANCQNKPGLRFQTQPYGTLIVTKNNNHVQHTLLIGNGQAVYETFNGEDWSDWYDYLCPVNLSSASETQFQQVSGILPEVNGGTGTSDLDTKIYSTVGQIYNSSSDIQANTDYVIMEINGNGIYERNIELSLAMNMWPHAQFKINISPRYARNANISSPTQSAASIRHTISGDIDPEILNHFRFINFYNDSTSYLALVINHDTSKTSLAATACYQRLTGGTTIALPLKPLSSRPYASFSSYTYELYQYNDTGRNATNKIQGIDPNLCVLENARIYTENKEFDYYVKHHIIRSGVSSAITVTIDCDDLVEGVVYNIYINKRGTSAYNPAIKLKSSNKDKKLYGLSQNGITLNTTATSYISDYSENKTLSIVRYGMIIYFLGY
jgi:hypothetical protein